MQAREYLKVDYLAVAEHFDWRTEEVHTCNKYFFKCKLI